MRDAFLTDLFRGDDILSFGEVMFYCHQMMTSPEALISDYAHTCAAAASTDGCMQSERHRRRVQEMMEEFLDNSQAAATGEEEVRHDTVSRSHHSNMPKTVTTEGSAVPTGNEMALSGHWMLGTWYSAKKDSSASCGSVVSIVSRNSYWQSYVIRASLPKLFFSYLERRL